MTRPKRKQPRDLLDKVLRLIEKDLNFIEEVATMKLDADVASTLVKYGDALLKMTRDSDKQDDEERGHLANFTKEELEKRAREILGNKK